MLRTILISASVALLGVATSANAADAPAAAAAPAAKLTTSDTTLGALLDNPAAKAVLEKHVGGMISNPQIEQAKGFTLKQIQGFAPDALTDDLLAKIDADLAKIPAK